MNVLNFRLLHVVLAVRLERPIKNQTVSQNELSFIVCSTPETQHRRSVIADRKKHGNVRIMDMPAWPKNRPRCI